MEMLNEMAVFAQVVDVGGFSAAARKLALTTSAVSRHVTRLETHLGGRLLVRTTRSMKLTELGEQVYAGCTRVVSTAREVHTLAGSYSARPNGVVRLTAPVVFGQVWLAPRLPDFLARYPDISIQLSLVDRNVDLVEDGVDLAIRISRALNPALAARPLCPMRYLLVASPRYLAQHGKPAHPKHLPDHHCIYLGYGAYGDNWTLHHNAPHTPGDARAETVHTKVFSRAAVNNSTAIMAMVESHGGIGLVPDFSARAALAAGRVEAVLPDWSLGDPYTGTVYAVYMPGPHLPLKVRTLIDYLVAAPEARLP